MKKQSFLIIDPGDFEFSAIEVQALTPQSALENSDLENYRITGIINSSGRKIILVANNTFKYCP